MFEIVFFIAVSVILALLLLVGFFHFLVRLVGVDATDRKPVLPWLLVSAIIGLVVVPIIHSAWRYFTVDPQTLSAQPMIHMIAPVVGVVLFGLVGGMLGLLKALRVEKTSIPRDEINQIQFSEISQWMKNEK